MSVPQLLLVCWLTVWLITSPIQTDGDISEQWLESKPIKLKGIASRIWLLLFVNTTFKDGPSSPAQSARPCGGPMC